MQGLAKHFPDLLARDFILTRIVEDEGHVIGGATARQTIEPFFFIDRRKSVSSPHRRLEALKLLQADLIEKLTKRGFYSANVWIDPQFSGFGRRLEALGWQLQLWDSYGLELPKG